MTKRSTSTARSLPIALLRAREKVMSPIRGMLADVGLTEQQWRVLRVLEEEGPMEPTRISDLACLLLPSLTRILQRLEEKKLIQRKPDKADRRRQIVKITPIGVQMIDANLEANLQALEGVRTRMGRDRYDLLLDLLNELDEQG
ncbi:homoprotocatechuate degradation operon regulator HpaR [Albibacillus kandeliae]|uniref:homoprotocatechuate degradation operon regulator HpaR n=1 Tax=Albibacillus kandeliae TaxID=2174228 RepID=UPI000D699EB5|nr:homoprotocatechuate degradation operon regulator HpaR [Albibacillus kandeliae]